METYFSTYKKTVEADIPIKMRYIKVYERMNMQRMWRLLMSGRLLS